MYVVGSVFRVLEASLVNLRFPRDARVVDKVRPKSEGSEAVRHEVHGS